MLDCPKCFSAQVTKDGVVKDKQRYKCKECNYRYRVAEQGAPKEIKRQALTLYLEGLGFRSIGRILKYSHVSVYKWIKGFGEKLEALKSDVAPTVVEIDEMHSYVGSKKTLAGYGLLLIELGKNSSIALSAPDDHLQEQNSGKH